MNQKRPTINILRKDEFGELFESPFQPLKETENGPQGSPETRGPGDADTYLDVKANAYGAPRMTDMIGDAPGLANRKAPYYYVQQEKPHHRVFLELAAKGYTVKEIAEMTGFTAVCVNNILRQPHIQQHLVNEIRDIYSVDEEVVTIIKDTAVAAVELFRDVIACDKAKTSDRIAAAHAILDRRYGKPNQPINRGTDVDLNNLSDDELAAMLPTTGSTGTEVCR